MRRKLSPMAYVELGQEKEEILLNLSEGGLCGAVGADAKLA